MTKLLGLRCRIQYKPGRENGAAGALFRRGKGAELSLITFSVLTWVNHVVQSYKNDAEIQRLLQQIAAKEDAVKDFTVDKGVIRKNGRIWLGNDQEMKGQILRSVHTRKVGGHSGLTSTYQRLHRNFAWK